MKEQLTEEFKKRFNKEPEHIFFCPGRVNIIGEHIDYNGGKVMPCAISMGTWLAVSRNADKLLRFESMDFPEKNAIELQPSYTRAGKEWFYYPLGVINELTAMGHVVSGLDMLFAGNLPIGSGLSSSASIEVLTAYAIGELFRLQLDKKEIAVFCKKVENEFIGVNSGIMDQFAVVMGKEKNAILLDCDTLGFEYLPLELGDYVLAIINTNKPRKLAESKYNERFAECQQALKAMQKELTITNLCEIEPDEFLTHRQLINDPVVEKRALHVVMENSRVKQAASALKENDLTSLGKLMFASHQSLRDLYEVSGKELDSIVSFCQNFDGCIGARMTGAGFGGCAIALVKKESLDDFSNKMTTFYTGEIGYAPGVFASGAEDGVRKIK